MEAKGSLRGSNGYYLKVQAGKHELMFDEPTDKHGTDKASTPNETLIASLVACTNMTVQMYARLKEWPLDEVAVTVSGEQEQGTGKLILQREISLTGNLDEAQKDRLLGIANRCPVHKILSQKNDIVTKLV
jgi:putative redox protein